MHSARLVMENDTVGEKSGGDAAEILDVREGDAAEEVLQVDERRQPAVVMAQEGAGDEAIEEEGGKHGEESATSEFEFKGRVNGEMESDELGTDQSLTVGDDHQGVSIRSAPVKATPTAVGSDDDVDLFVEVQQQDLAGLDQSDEFFDSGEALIAGEASHSVAEIGHNSTADDDVERERLEEKAMVEAIRLCLTEDVWADHVKKHQENFTPRCGNNLELSMSSRSELEQVAEAMLVDQKEEQTENVREGVATIDNKSEAPTQSGCEPDVKVDELHDSSSSYDENKASSVPAQSSAPSCHSNDPSLPSRLAGLGPSPPLLKVPARSIQKIRANGPGVVDGDIRQGVESVGDNEADNDEIREKLQLIRVKFLRLANRFGETPNNMVVSQVLYRLGLAEQIRRIVGHDVFSFDRAQEMAEQLEAAGNEPLDFSCTILVLGKTGVGKSATINSIFDDVRLETNAFASSTRKVQQVVGTVEGIKVRVIDTPGISCSSSDQHYNLKVLNSVKRAVRKTPPDIVLYFDRLDIQSGDDYGDVSLLQTMSEVFGASVWSNAILVLTHAASSPPEGPNGIPLSYEMFVTQRSHVVQQAIRQAAGDVRLMNPVSLVENHSECRKNMAGQRVLPNGQVWKSQLLLLCFASKVLAEANVLLKLQDNLSGKPSSTRNPQLPYLLSSLLQSRPPLKLSGEQSDDDDDDLEDDLIDGYGSDDCSDYDDLPPFKRLTKAEFAKLSRAQRNAYLEEIDYREKLFYKKHLKQEHIRREMMKKMAAMDRAREDDIGSNGNLEDDDANAPTNVSVPMPDMILPSTFDSDYPSHRYRFLDTSSQWLVRPVLETQGWDHDVGYEGLNAERSFDLKGKVPVYMSGQMTKDKKDCSLQMELASSVKHSDSKTTSLAMDLQSVGKDMSYTICVESRHKNSTRNSTTVGISSTLLGDSVTAGLKVEDKLVVNRQLSFLVNGGAMTGTGDAAYGGRLEATLRDRDYPVGRMLSSLAVSVVEWNEDLAIGCNVQSQVPAGRSSNLIGYANLSNKGAGQIGIRLNSSEHLQIALLAIVPIYQSIVKLLNNYSESF